MKILFTLRERGREGEREREKHPCVVAFHAPPTCTQACALTGNRTSDTLIPRHVLREVLMGWSVQRAQSLAHGRIKVAQVKAQRHWEPLPPREPWASQPPSKSLWGSELDGAWTACTPGSTVPLVVGPAQLERSGALPPVLLLSCGER